MSAALLLLAIAAIEFGCIVILRKDLTGANRAYRDSLERSIVARQQHDEDMLAWINLCARQDLELERLRAMCAGDRRWLS